jgi:mannose/fructose-specific phosphotransferase system component IIA
MDSKLGDLVKNPQAKAVIDQYLPGVTTHPMYSMISGMSLNMILSFPQAAQFGVTKEKLEAILVEVNKATG